MRKLLIITFIFTSIAGNAKNYYVKSTGNDNNTGLSDPQAWSTIAKVNSSSFSAGDTISFNKGDTWREQLTIPSSGDADAYVVFSSYGTGLAPKIIGSAEVTTWTNYSGNVWVSSNTLTDPYSLTYYGNIYFKETYGSISWGRVKKAVIANLAVEYYWVWNSNHIYIYSPADPNTRYSGIEVSQREKCVDPNGKDYLTFNGLDVAYSGSCGFGSDPVPIIYHTCLLVENCKVQSGMAICTVFSKGS